MSAANGVAALAPGRRGLRLCVLTAVCLGPLAAACPISCSPRQARAPRPAALRRAGVAGDRPVPILLAIGREGPARNQVVIGLLAAAPYRPLDVGLSGKDFQVVWSRDHTMILGLGLDATLEVRYYDARAERFGHGLEPCAVSGRSERRYIVPWWGHFSWSPDGRAIVMCQNEHGLVVVELSTGRRRVILRYPSQFDLEKLFQDNTVAWSPDGRKIAYSIVGHDLANRTTGEYYDDLWLVNPDGTGRRKLGHGREPCWSADGKYILVVSGEGHTVARYDAATGAKRILLYQPQARYWHAVYSPDGERIAVQGPLGNAPGRGVGIFLADAHGRFLRDLYRMRESDTDMTTLAW